MSAAPDGTLMPSGLKKRFSVLTLDDLRFFAGRFATADAFADRILDTSSSRHGRKAVIELWRRWEREGTLGLGAEPHDPLSGASPLARRVAERIGASRFEKVGVAGAPWSRARGEMIFGPEGYLLTGSWGGVYLDATEMPGKRAIWMSQMSVERRRQGIGTAAMEALREYALERELAITVFSVTNPRFFGRFDWLSPRGGCFQAELDDLRPSAFRP